MKEYKTSYVLDNFKEFERLEKQAKQKNYSLEDELRNLDLSGSKKVLDAGCGSGVLSRYLKSQNSSLEIVACDYSEIRIHQSRKFHNSDGKINYIQADLSQLPFADNEFDVVISRFVYEYLDSPSQVTKELSRILRPGGILYLIDLDGVFLNFWTSNSRLNFLLKELEKGLDFDLFVGRKLPSHLNQAGLKLIDWKMSIHEFKNFNDVNEEIENNVCRITGAREKFTKIFKSENIYEEFLQLYVQEMTKILHEGNMMFFNKVIAWGTK